MLVLIALGFLGACSQNNEPEPLAVFAGPLSIPQLHPKISSSTGLGFGFANTNYQNFQDQIEAFGRLFNGPEETEEVSIMDGYLEIRGEIQSFRAFQYFDSSRQCRKVVQMAITDQGQFFEYFNACGSFGGDTGIFTATWHAFQSHDRQSGYVGNQFANFKRLEWNISETNASFSRSWPWRYKFEMDPNTLSGEIKVGGTSPVTDEAYLKYISSWDDNGSGSFTLYNPDGSVDEEGSF